LILLATGMPGVDSFIAENFPEVYAAEDGIALLDYTNMGDTAVIALSFLEERELIETIYKLQLKGVRVVVIADNPAQNAALLRSLLGMGVLDYIIDPGDGDEIITAISTQGNIATARQKLGVVMDLVQVAPPPDFTENQVRIARPSIRMAGAFTPAGGAGKTTTTVYVAGALQQMHNIPTGILELDEDKPGIASIFLGGDKVNRNIGLDVLGLDVYRSETLLGKKLQEIRIPLTKGITLYPNTGNTDGMPFETSEDVYRLFEAVQRMHQLVLVDLPVRLKDLVVLSTLRRADMIFFICEQYQPTIDACARHLEDAVRLGIDTGKYILVVNKFNENSRIKVARIENALGMKARALIPLDAERYRLAADRHQLSFEEDDPWVSLAAMVAGVEAPAANPKTGKKGKRKKPAGKGSGGVLTMFGLLNLLRRKKEVTA